MAELGRSDDEYYLALKKLLPKGPAWELDNNCFFMKMLELASLEFARIDADIKKLIDESDPRTASVTLAEWFYQWDIPDECLKLLGEEDLALYQKVLVTKISSQGYTFEELINLLAIQLGYSNVNVKTYDVFTVASRVNEAIYSDLWQSTVKAIMADGTPIIPFRVTSRVNERLNTWGNALWECLVKSLAPAHCNIIFQYGSEEN